MSANPTPAGLVRALMSVANGADDALLAEILAADFTRHGDPLSESATGVDAARSLVRKMRRDMPDLEVTLLDELSAAERIAIRWRLSGTDSGPGDYPPTGRHATADGMSFFEVRDGRIAREWTIVDGITLLTRLGFRILPP
ncbi:MAG TPA: ester cyclase [Gemmatimonadales bacterium]|nr:ester cyclase [Gemmatimonadales bacterium]